jgi:hypothetical protein
LGIFAVSRQQEASSIIAVRRLDTSVQGGAGLRLEQVQQHADGQVIVELGAIIRTQKVVLVFHKELVHELAIRVSQFEAEQRARGGRGKVALVGLDGSSEDGGFSHVKGSSSRHR